MKFSSSKSITNTFRLPFYYLYDPLQTLYLSSHGIIVTSSGERSPQLCDFACSFVNCDDVPIDKKKKKHENLFQNSGSIHINGYSMYGYKYQSI